MSENLTISLYKKPIQHNASVFAESLKLAMITGGIAMAVQGFSKNINQKTTTINSYDYLKGMALLGTICGITHTAFGLFVPMWREVTEYRPDTSPFKRDLSFLNTEIHEINKDLYS